MSYNTWATRENVIYKARVAEQFGRTATCYIVDLLEADDGGPVAEDGLNLEFFDEPVEADDIIYLKRIGNSFKMRRDKRQFENDHSC